MKRCQDYVGQNFVSLKFYWAVKEPKSLGNAKLRRTCPKEALGLAMLFILLGHQLIYSCVKWDSWGK